MKNELQAEHSKYAHSQLLGFSLSLNCPASCRSCAYECGPDRAEVLSAETAINILETFSDSYKAYLMPFFGFTGGEPFLHLDLIGTLSRYVQKRFGFGITITTNCFWARNRQTALRILGELKNIGLVHLGISVDDFHQEFVALEKVRTAIHAAVESEITCYVQCAETKTSKKMEDYQARLNIDSKLVKWGKVSCDPIGRASHAIPAADLDLRWRAGMFEACSMFKTWIIDHQGRVTACCGSGASMVPSAGNALTTPLAEIINQAQLNPLYNALVITGGPAMLIELLAQNGMEKYSQRSFTGPCHACSSIFQDKRATRLLYDLLAPRSIELLAERLMVQEQVQASQPPERFFFS